MRMAYHACAHFGVGKLILVLVLHARNHGAMRLKMLHVECGMEESHTKKEQNKENSESGVHS